MGSMPPAPLVALAFLPGRAPGGPSPFASPFTVALLALGALLLAAALLYNHLRTRKNQIDYAEAAADAALKKRFDLIPNLNRTVAGYAEHERELFTALARARSALERDAARGARLDAVRLQHEAELTRAVDGALLLAEDYPELRAAESFLALQRELAAVEEEIAAARRFVVAAINDYNNAVQTVPGVFLAGALGLEPRRQPRIPALQRVAPRVRVPTGGRP